MSGFAASLSAEAAEALLVFVVAVLIGWIADQMLFRLINSRTAATGWAAGRQLASGLHGLPTVIGVLLGARMAARRLPLSAEWSEAVSTTINLLAILAATAFAARVLGRIVRAYTEREGSRLPSTSIFVNLARALVWVLGLISLLAALGVAIAPLVTALGVGGIAVGLALQPTLENIFSGIQVLASRQIEPGDLIRLETGEEGAVL
ncbi:MAG TPA: mechanosensitive ion channel family protein, partial [Coriobacteriia bacterium]|nr:mechanosensitive ion channel family protein [Coriobacteriia bacterium]